MDTIDLNGRTFESLGSILKRLDITHQTFINKRVAGKVPNKTKIGARDFYDQQKLNQMIAELW